MSTNAYIRHTCNVAKLQLPLAYYTAGHFLWQSPSTEYHNSFNADLQPSVIQIKTEYCSWISNISFSFRRPYPLGLTCNSDPSSSICGPSRARGLVNERVYLLWVPLPGHPKKKLYRLGVFDQCPSGTICCEMPLTRWPVYHYKSTWPAQCVFSVTSFAIAIQRHGLSTISGRHMRRLPVHEEKNGRDTFEEMVSFGIQQEKCFIILLLFENKNEIYLSLSTMVMYILRLDLVATLNR